MSPKTERIRRWFVELVTVGVILCLGYLSLQLVFGQIRFWFPLSWWVGVIMIFLGLPTLHQYLIKLRAKFI